MHGTDSGTLTLGRNCDDHEPLTEHCCARGFIYAAARCGDEGSDCTLWLHTELFIVFSEFPEFAGSLKRGHKGNPKALHWSEKMLLALGIVGLKVSSWSTTVLRGGSWELPIRSTMGCQSCC